MAIIRRVPITPMGLTGVSGVALGVRLTVARATAVLIVPIPSVSTATARVRPCGGCWHAWRDGIPPQQFFTWILQGAVMTLHPAIQLSRWPQAQQATALRSGLPKETTMKPLL
jgi:hypothetical protein